MRFMDTDIDEQMRIICRGVEESFPEGELRQTLVESRKEGRPLRVKLGVDPTASDLHLGHIIPMLKLKAFQDLGHQAVLIIGDYTAMIGDPSGRNKARPQLTHDQVMDYCKTYKEQVFKILDAEQTEVAYNGEWFGKMDFAQVTGLISHMTLARMLEREDFSSRYNNGVPISLHELIYPLMQGYDSVMVNADIELGGTDQKFNILVGRDLQKARGQRSQVGICLPILIGTDGTEKMSKSLGNYIGLSEKPEEMYGKVMSIPDDLMWMYFELITDVPMPEVQEMKKEVGAGGLHPMKVKRRLARAIVARFHNHEAATQAENHFDLVFKQKETPQDLPVFEIPEEEMDEGKVWIVRLLVLVGFASSNGQARRLIQGGGVRIGGKQVKDTDLDWAVTPGAVLQAGKRRFVEIR